MSHQYITANRKNGNGKPMKRIVVIGGGTGTFTVLTGLKRYADIWPIAIVSMADDGGSTGTLRTSMGVLPPGDIRRALVALAGSRAEKTLLQLFNYRFPSHAVEAHSFGNLFLAALEQILGGFDRAVATAGSILGVKGEVIPVTTSDVRLHARYEDGSIVHGETNIDIPAHDANLRITDVWLDPAGDLHARAREAILMADLIVIGPGDVFTSIIPNILVHGMSRTLSRAPAPKIYVANVMTKRGETQGFAVHDFVRVMETYLGTNVLTHILYNSAIPPSKSLTQYRTEGSDIVRSEEKLLPRQTRYRYIAADMLDANGLVRHDPEKLARIIREIANERHDRTPAGMQNAQIPEMFTM